MGKKKKYDIIEKIRAIELKDNNGVSCTLGEFMEETWLENYNTFADINLVLKTCGIQPLY